VFRVVRVSGTMRKSQEEAIRRAREMIAEARQEMDGQGDSILDNIFGQAVDHTGVDFTKDVLMVDKSDSEGEGELSDDDG
jgi:ribonuclease P/MRP protein subunit POP5